MPSRSTSIPFASFAALLVVIPLVIFHVPPSVIPDCGFLYPFIRTPIVFSVSFSPSSGDCAVMLTAWPVRDIILFVAAWLRSRLFARTFSLSAIHQDSLFFARLNNLLTLILDSRSSTPRILLFSRFLLASPHLHRCLVVFLFWKAQSMLARWHFASLVMHSASHSPALQIHNPAFCPGRLSLIYHEYASWLYSLSAYFFSKSIIDLPRQLANALLFSVIGLHSPRFISWFGLGTTLILSSMCFFLALVYWMVGLRQHGSSRLSFWFHRLQVFHRRMLVWLFLYCSWPLSHFRSCHHSHDFGHHFLLVFVAAVTGDVSLERLCAFFDFPQHILFFCFASPLFSLNSLWLLVLCCSLCSFCLEGSMSTTVCLFRASFDVCSAPCLILLFVFLSSYSSCLLGSFRFAFLFLLSF